MGLTEPNLWNVWVCDSCFFQLDWHVDVLRVVVYSSNISCTKNWAPEGCNYPSCSLYYLIILGIGWLHGHAWMSGQVSKKYHIIERTKTCDFKGIILLLEAGYVPTFKKQLHLHPFQGEGRAGKKIWNRNIIDILSTTGSYFTNN